MGQSERVQLTYNALRDQTGAVLAVYDVVNDSWVDEENRPWSDIVIECEGTRSDSAGQARGRPERPPPGPPPKDTGTSTTTRTRPTILVGPPGHQYALGPFVDDEAASAHLRRFPDNGEMLTCALSHPGGPVFERIVHATATLDLGSMTEALEALARFDDDRPLDADNDDARIIVRAFRMLVSGPAEGKG